MTQLFKHTFDNNILFDFLEKICDKKDNHYLFDSNAYKRAQLNNNLNLFLDTLKPYYYLSKRFYLERIIDYNKLSTIIRQICKFKHISFYTNIKYSKSKYNIPYYIYYA